MKTLIIPDLHNRVGWIEPFLCRQRYDKVVFLGDYFDNFYDTSEDIERTSRWLKKSISYKNRVHLIGTHDIWYMFPHNFNLMASGNNVQKSNIINNILEESDWKKLKLFYFEQSFLISHAGLHSYTLGYSSIISLFRNTAIEDANNCINNPLLEAGIVRGGSQMVGGITWLDWNYEFEPIPCLNQIVGHTEFSKPQSKSTKFSKNYCIDTRNKYYGTLENNMLKCSKTKVLNTLKII
jgi:hypothetical protein